MKKKTVSLLICLLLSLLCVFPVCAEKTQTPYIEFNESFFNPFMATANDPWLIRDGEDIYYSTGVKLYHATSITGLMSAIANPESLKMMAMLPDQTEVWAPEIHHYQNHWYYFYAADYDNDNVQHRMYVVKSKTDDPMGEWEPPVMLNLPDGEWGIDGTFFEYRDGRIFLIWSGWRDEKQGTSQWKQYLYIVQLETGDPTSVASTERIVISKPRYYWEMSVQPQNEGPAVLVSPEGTYYCMYSGNYSASNEYVIAALRLNGDPLDASAWEKLDEPVLASNREEEIYAPGHASFIKSPDGTEDWIIFHTAKSDLSGWKRNGRAQKIEWINDTPTIEKIIPNDELIPLPSGENVDRILVELEDGDFFGSAAVTEGLTTSAAVTMPDSTAGIQVTVNAPQDGTYALYIRHNSVERTESTIWITVDENNSTKGMTAVWSNNDHQFVLGCTLVDLQQGLNTLNIQTQGGISLDLLVFDRSPVTD